jgi:hypothetical protein
MKPVPENTKGPPFESLTPKTPSMLQPRPEGTLDEDVPFRDCTNLNLPILEHILGAIVRIDRKLDSLIQSTDPLRQAACTCQTTPNADSLSNRLQQNICTPNLASHIDLTKSSDAPKKKPRSLPWDRPNQDTQNKDGTRTSIIHRNASLQKEPRGASTSSQPISTRDRLVADKAAGSSVSQRQCQLDSSKSTMRFDRETEKLSKTPNESLVFSDSSLAANKFSPSSLYSPSLLKMQRNTLSKPYESTKRGYEADIQSNTNDDSSNRRIGKKCRHSTQELGGSYEESESESEGDDDLNVLQRSVPKLRSVRQVRPDIIGDTDSHLRRYTMREIAISSEPELTSDSSRFSKSQQLSTYQSDAIGGGATSPVNTSQRMIPEKPYKAKYGSVEDKEGWELVLTKGFSLSKLTLLLTKPLIGHRIPGTKYHRHHITVANEQLSFTREPNCVHDNNAIAIYNTSSEQVAYMARNVAKVLAPYMVGSCTFSME